MARGQLVEALVGAAGPRCGTRMRSDDVLLARSLLRHDAQHRSVCRCSISVVDTSASACVCSTQFRASLQLSARLWQSVCGKRWEPAVARERKQFLQDTREDLSRSKSTAVASRAVAFAEREVFGISAKRCGPPASPGRPRPGTAGTCAASLGAAADGLRRSAAALPVGRWRCCRRRGTRRRCPLCCSNWAVRRSRRGPRARARGPRRSYQHASGAASTPAAEFVEDLTKEEATPVVMDCVEIKIFEVRHSPPSTRCSMAWRTGSSPLDLARATSSPRNDFVKKISGAPTHG